MQLIFLIQLQIVKHSFIYLKALFFLFVEVLYEFRLLSSTSQKLSSLLITKFISISYHKFLFKSQGVSELMDGQGVPF